MFLTTTEVHAWTKFQSIKLRTHQLCYRHTHHNSPLGSHFFFNFHMEFDLQLANKKILRNVYADTMNQETWEYVDSVS